MLFCAQFVGRCDGKCVHKPAVFAALLLLLLLVLKMFNIQWQPVNLVLDLVAIFRSKVALLYGLPGTHHTQ